MKEDLLTTRLPCALLANVSNFLCLHRPASFHLARNAPFQPCRWPPICVAGKPYQSPLFTTTRPCRQRTDPAFHASHLPLSNLPLPIWPTLTSAKL